MPGGYRPRGIEGPFPHGVRMAARAQPAKGLWILMG